MSRFYLTGYTEIYLILVFFFASFLCQISSLRCDHLEDLLLVSILASVLITSPTKMGFEMIPLNFSHNSFFLVLLTSAFEIINFLLIVKFFHLDLCSIAHLLLKLLSLSDMFSNYEFSTQLSSYVSVVVALCLPLFFVIQRETPQFPPLFH